MKPPTVWSEYSAGRHAVHGPSGPRYDQPMTTEVAVLLDPRGLDKRHQQHDGRGLSSSATYQGPGSIDNPRPWRREGDPSNLAVPPPQWPHGGGNVEGRWECIHRKRWMKGFGDLELSTRIHKERRWRGQRPVTLAVSHASRSCPHVHRYPQALELHGGNAVGRLRSPKATVHSSSASPGLRILPFDGPARASIRAHTHLTRANEALTSPMAWRLCWASRSKLLAA